MAARCVSPLILLVIAAITSGEPVNGQTLEMPATMGQDQNSATSPVPVVDSEVAQVGFTSEIDNGGTSGPPVTKELIASEISAVDANVDLTTEQREEIKARLQKAVGWLDEAATAKTRQEELETQLPQIPQQLRDARAMLTNFSDAEFQVMPTGKTIAELETQLAALRQQVEGDGKEFAFRESEIENRTNLTTSRAKEIVELEQRIPSLRTQLETIKATDASTRSQRLELQARLRLREQELLTRKLERRRLEESTELLPLQRDLAKRVLSNRQKMLQRWQTSIDNLRKEESRRQAEAARRIAENAHPALKSLAEQNAQIAEERVKTAAAIQTQTELIKNLNQLSDQLNEDFKDLSSRVEHAGTTSTTGLLLRKKRSELPSDQTFLERNRLVQTTMPAAHLMLMEWKRLRLNVADTEEAAKTIMLSLKSSLGNTDPEQVESIVIRLLEDRRALLDKAIPDQNTYLQDLNQLDLDNQTLQTQVAEFRHYLNQRVLWIRSTNMISVNDLREAKVGMETILEPQRWQESMRVGGIAMLRRPVVGVGMIAMLLLLIVFRARLQKTQFELLAEPAGNTPMRFRRYFGSFLISCLHAARWPVLLLAVGFRLHLSSENGTWTHSVGDALITSVAFLWGCELIRELCRKDCVGEKAFGWPAEATAKVRNTLELTALIGTPLFALLQLTQYGELDGMQSLQRLLFIGVLTLFGVQLGWLTRPSGGLMKCLNESCEGSLVYRTRHAIWFVLAASPLALAILSSVGYHFSAYQLSGRLAETGAILVGMILMYSLALCWLNVISFNRSLVPGNQSPELVINPDSSPVSVAGIAPVNNLSPAESTIAESSDGAVRKTDVIAKTTGQALASESAQANEQALASEPAQAVVNEAADYDGSTFYSAAHNEVRDVLQYACWIVMIASGWFIWSDVLPALRLFDYVVLWQNVESVPEMRIDANGSESVQFVDHTVPTTLTDLFVAVMICFATLMIGRRVPGVLQLVLLEHLPIQPGGRQAIGILTRYFATVAGLLLACGVIRLSWGSVQWLAAAMTVGLGFGLQEIFANLVSGLIILVERPIRVGDIVTVGDVTGTITRMQMRATTVTDYDRRELIVPNKKFITDNVINWTLSDPISRVVLPVGVAYGTDVGKVRDVLLKIADQCPIVLDEPAPNTLFKGFGDSTLNVQLMVYIPQRSVYIEVVNELNAAIAREFEREQIGISFPQLDLHVKNSDVILPTQLATQAKSNASKSNAA